MTKEQYLRMKEMQGKPPKPHEIPLDFSDLSYDCQVAMSIYNSLGNRIYESVGFVGKDMTLLPMLIDYHGIQDVEHFMEYICLLDDYNVDKSQKEIKKITDNIGKK